MSAVILVVVLVFLFLAYHIWRSVGIRRPSREYKSWLGQSLKFIFLDMLPPFLIVLFFANFYMHGAFIPAVHNMVLFVQHSFTSARHNLYYGVSLIHIWFTVRLVLIASVFAVMGAFVLFFLRSQLSSNNRFGKLLSILSSIAESVPDSIYVIGTVVLVVILLFNYGVNIPAFTDADPKWHDTWIPAFVLSLPSLFSLQRVLFARFDEERHARYIETALAKGSSRRRVYFRHVLPNVFPVFWSEVPVMMTLIISSSLFTEFFLEYIGQLFQFLNAVGESIQHGWAALLKKGGNMLPVHHDGTVFVIGALLVALWMIVNYGVGFGLRALYPRNVTTVAAAGRVRIQWKWIIAGSVVLALVVLTGIFPELFTPFTPSHRDLTSSATMPPIHPNHLHPLGTDAMGRDFLSITLYGILPSIIPAVIITVAVVIGALFLSIIAVRNPNGWMSKVARWLSRTTASTPTLFVLFLALYPTNLMLQGGKAYHPISQAIHYILWIAVVEIGPFTYALYQSMQEWLQFSFIEPAVAVGRGPVSLMFSHLRSWLGRHLVEFGFTEFVRVLSLMTQLAALHIYFQEKVGLLPFKPFNVIRWPHGIVTAAPSWFGALGNATLNMSFISYPFYLYGPLAALIITMLGANFVAFGLRGYTADLK